MDVFRNPYGAPVSLLQHNLVPTLQTPAEHLDSLSSSCEELSFPPITLTAASTSASATPLTFRTPC